MGLYTWKFEFRKFLYPLLKLFKKVNPDLISYFAVFISLLTGICFYFADKFSYFFLLGAFLIFLRMVLNTLDGMIALEQKRESLQGEIVNALPDRYSDIFTLYGICFSSYSNFYLGALALVFTLLVSYTGMLGKAIGVSWQHQGPLGKVERLISLIIFSLLQFLLIKLNISVNLSGLLFIWFILGSQITIFNRVRGMLKELRSV